MVGNVPGREVGRGASRKVRAVSTRGWMGIAARRVGLSGIGLIVLTLSTVVLVAVTVFHTPTPTGTEAAAAAARPTAQSASTPSTKPSASTPSAKPSIATPSASASAGPQVVAFLGDSYASGSGASTQSKRWVNLVSLDQGWVMKNLSQKKTSYSTAGEPGGTSYTARLDAVIATGASIVVVSGGRNDVDVSAAQLRADVRATFAGIRLGLPKARIIVVSPIWDDGAAPVRMTALASIVQAEAKLAGATYLDIGEPLSKHNSMVTYDGVHPNDIGHAAIAAAVEKALSSR